jgi:hypothetical protein
MNTVGSALPAIPAGTDLRTAVNDRLRRISAMVATPATSTSSGSGGAGSELILCKPGILGIQSSACPLVSLASDQQPVALVVLLGQASVGGSFTIAVSAGGNAIGGVTLLAGATSGSAGGLSIIPANAVVVVAITAVGLTFPGADLTVMVRF